MATFTVKLVFDVEAASATDAIDVAEAVVGDAMFATLDALPGGWVIAIAPLVED
jgi:hypothetical protein